MFWTRSDREARRQEVLDELLELDPSRRRLRLDIAVAAGEVKRSEVELALVLVKRLDALRVMTVPASGYLPGGIPAVATRPAKPAKTRRSRRSTGKRRVDTSAGITVAGDPESPTVFEPRPVSSEARGGNRAILKSSGPAADVVSVVGPEIVATVPAAPAAVANPSSGPEPAGIRRRPAGTGRPPSALLSRLAEAALEPAAVPAHRGSVDPAKREDGWPSIAWLRP